MSLVEVLVSMALLAGVSLPLAHVANTALVAANANGNRQDGAQVALGVIAKLEAVPYGEVGFTTSTLASAETIDPSYGTESGSPAGYSWQGRTLVQLAASSQEPSFALGTNAVPFSPVMTGVTTGGGSFAIVTHISEDSASVPTCPGNTSRTTALADAYAHVWVWVGWRDAGVPSSIELDSVVYPGGLGSYRGPSYVAADTPRCTLERHRHAGGGHR